jgi:chemotaxis family two-component system response regulator Rcp1
MSVHVLLVEDNPSDVELLCTAFEELKIDATFTIFRAGDEAITGIREIGRIAEKIPAIAFLDLNMPRASGHEVLASIRKQPIFDIMPVLVFSTSNHPVDRHQCLAAGASDYLVKPPHFYELLRLIGSIEERWLKTA